MVPQVRSRIRSRAEAPTRSSGRRVALDEVFVTIQSWRALDQDDDVIDEALRDRHRRHGLGDDGGVGPQRHGEEKTAIPASAPPRMIFIGGDRPCYDGLVLLTLVNRTGSEEKFSISSELFSLSNFNRTPMAIAPSPSWFSSRLSTRMLKG